MRHAQHTSLGAATALAAVLALASTPGHAQDAAPSLDLPTTVTPPAQPAAPAAPTATVPAPTVAAPSTPIAAPAATAPHAQPRIVLPDVTSQATPEQTSTAPTESRPAPAPRAERAEQRANRSAARSTAPAAAAPLATSGTGAPGEVIDAAPQASDLAANAAPAPVTEPGAIQESAQTAPTLEATGPEATGDDSGIPGSAIAGLLAALGLGAVGFVALRRRRRPEEQADYVAVAAPVAAPTPRAIDADRIVASHGMEAPAAESRVAPVRVPEMPVREVAATERRGPVRYDVMGMPIREPVADTTLAERRAASPAEPSVAARTTATEPLRNTPVASGPIATGEDRQDLLDRMVSASPDEANPFTSPRARRRRARMILQSRAAGQDGNLAGSGTASDAFDWRTYKPSAKSPTLPTPSLAEV